MITLDQVLSVYSGKVGSCCCGCSGKHYYSEATRQAAGKNRGYKVDDNEINERMMKKVVNILNKESDINRNESYAAVEIGTRLYIAYFKE